MNQLGLPLEDTSGHQVSAPAQVDATAELPKGFAEKVVVKRKSRSIEVYLTRLDHLWEKLVGVGGFFSRRVARCCDGDGSLR